MADMGRAAKALTKAAAAAAKAKGKGSYTTTRFEFSTGLAGAVADYLNDGSRSARNEAKRLAIEKVWEAGARGFRDGAGDPGAEVLGEDSKFLGSLQDEALDFIDTLFDDLVVLRKKDPIIFPQGRVDQFTNSLDGTYSAMKLRGAANPMLEFSGSDGAATCATCAKLKGKQRKAKWWLENDLIPGAANLNYVCGGFRCQHYLTTLDGKRFTV